MHEEYGGRSEAVPLEDEHAALATRTVRVAEELLGADLAYARVDLMRLADGTLAVGELEVTEPGLYLDLVPRGGGRVRGDGRGAARLDARGRRALPRSPAETPSHPRGPFRLGPPGRGVNGPVGPPTSV